MKTQALLVLLLLCLPLANAEQAKMTMEQSYKAIPANGSMSEAQLFKKLGKPVNTNRTASLTIFTYRDARCEYGFSFYKFGMADIYGLRGKSKMCNP
jgi:hypothetical protein